MSCLEELTSCQSLEALASKWGGLPASAKGALLQRLQQKVQGVFSWLKEKIISEEFLRVVKDRGVDFSRLCARKIQPIIDKKIASVLPVVTKKDRDALIEEIVAPRELSEKERALQTVLEGVLEWIKNFIKQYILRKDIETLLDDAVKRVFTKGRLESIAYNVLHRVNSYTAPIVQDEGYRVTDEEIDQVLECSKQELLQSKYYTKIGWFSRVCIAPKLAEAFTREAFDGYVERFESTIDRFLKFMQGEGKREVDFANPEQKRAFAQRMVLEMLQVAVEEISDPIKEVVDYEVFEGLDQEVRTLLLSLQRLIPERAVLLEELEEPADELVEKAIRVEECVQESQDFFARHPWIAKGLSFCGYDTSKEAMQKRLEDMRAKSAALEEPKEEAAEEVRDIDKATDILAQLFNKALRSSRTIDLLFKEGFSLSSLLERYRITFLGKYNPA